MINQRLDVDILVFGRQLIIFFEFHTGLNELQRAMMTNDNNIVLGRIVIFEHPRKEFLIDIATKTTLGSNGNTQFLIHDLLILRPAEPEQAVDANLGVDAPELIKEE